MKSKVTTIIMSLMIILIFAVLGIFGILIMQEIEVNETISEVENYVSTQKTISKNTDEKENIKTPSIIENKVDEILNGINEIEEIEEIVEPNYNEVIVNKYFFNQLDEPAQIIYKAFESNKENMKTGTYEIDFGTSFSSLLSKNYGDKALGVYYQSAIEAYLYDNPDVFYLAPTKMYLNIETITRGSEKSYRVFINQGEGNNYFSDEYSSKSQIDAALNDIEVVKNKLLAKKTGNTYEDIKLVHDYLVDNVEYDTTISKNNIYNIYGALVNKVAVCEGYAKSFKYLMDAFGIPCTIIIGQATNSQGETENHAWNYVQMDEKWYAIDCTWDDPVVVGGGSASKDSKYKYFLKGKDEFLGNHVPNGQFTEGGKVFSYPEL